MNLDKLCPEKLVDAKTAVSRIRQGSRVFIGTGCGEPQHLIRTMIQDSNIQDVMIYQMLSHTLSQVIEDEGFQKRFSLKLFFISRTMRRAASAGKLDYIPTYLSQIPELFYSGRIGLDVALIQVSPPGPFGYCSLGVSVDITRAGMASAKLVIAQVNADMPRTSGHSFVHVDDIDLFVRHDESIVNNLYTLSDEEEEISRRIGMYVAQVVEDGATLQVGYGYLPNAVLKYLDQKKDLGIHTQVITDGLLPLLEKKVITNTRKTLVPGRVVASLCMGSPAIYNYVNDNPMFDFRGSDFVNDPKVIARNDNLVSIGSALEVDLTGQVCSDSLGNVFYSGIGDQVDFQRGAAMSRGGFSIIVMPSTAMTPQGRVSRIQANLSEGAGIAATRADVDIIITEHGIAELQGKSIYQRVMELIQIAHPDFRDDLMAKAKERGYIFEDQLPPVNEDLIFLEDYKRRVPLSSGKQVLLRPLLPSDELMYRNFFYSLDRESVYKRFYYDKTNFSHHTVQQHYDRIDYRNNMFLIGLISRKRHQEIVAIGSYMDMGNQRAEVAFVTRDDFHDQGIATAMLDQLEFIARENGFTSFFALTMRNNAAMVHIFKKRYPDVEIDYDGKEVYLSMQFS